MSRLSGDDVLEQLAESLNHELQLRKIDKETAAEIAVSVTEKLRFNLGGQNIYFTKFTLHQKLIRDRDIYRKFTGNNYQELAMEYELSEMRIRQIIHKVACIQRQERRP
ncbi:Mor transcription activator family protein [Azonexus sp.]|uniref:Mor transcription activator family protein n=1 Tax=Azonexus sp. TaxID=1872668 RepID=UPI0035ADEBAA